MRIAYSGTFWSMATTGSGQYLHHLLRALRQVAPQHEQVLLLPDFMSLSSLPEEVESARVATPLDRHNEDLAKVWYEQIALPRACRRQRVDLAHIPYFAPPMFSRSPTVVTIHDLIPLLLPDYCNTRAVRAYTRLVSRTARRADMILTDSQASASDIQRLLGIPDERLRITYLAADEQYRPVPRAACQELQRRLGVQAPYLLYLGGFDCRKNVIGLLHALALCRERLSDVSLVIAGKLPEVDTPFAADPRPVADELGLSDSVTFTGWVEETDKPALYSGALAFVFPSYYEGFGLPVLEAISCGTPAIVGSGSSLEEIAGPGGLMVPPDDIEALAEAMVRVAQDALLRRELAEKGLQHAARFSWHKTAEQTLAAYETVLRGGG